MEAAGANALVTGAARRIGRALAIALAEAGADVIVHYNTSRGDAYETVDLIRAMGRKAEAVQADLSHPSQCAMLWEESIRRMGEPPRIVINNASYYGRSSIEGTSVESWERAMSVNVRAPFLLAKAMADSVCSEGEAKIVNINDQRQAYRSRFAYGVTVAALSGLTQSLALSLSPQIQVNEVLLAPVLPPVDGGSLGDASTLSSSGATRPLVTTDEVAQAVIELIRDDDLNGASVRVDVGRKDV